MAASRSRAAAFGHDVAEPPRDLGGAAEAVDGIRSPADQLARLRGLEQRVGVHAALEQAPHERLRLAKQLFGVLAPAASCGERRSEEEAPDLDPLTGLELACPLEVALSLAVVAASREDQPEAPGRVHGAEPVPDRVELGEATAQEALRRVEVAGHDLDVRKGDRIRRRGLPEPEVLDERVTLGHEGAPLVERALHCAQGPEPAERRRTRVAIRRVLEDRLDPPSRLFDRLPAAPEQHAEPARGDAFDEVRAGSACVLRCQPELLFGVERRRSGTGRAAVRHVVRDDVRVRECFVVAGRFEDGDRLAQVLEHALRIDIRGTPEREVEARDLEPSVRALVPWGRGGRGFVDHARGGVALAVPPERVGQGGGELEALGRAGWEQRSRSPQQSRSRRRIAPVVRSAAGGGQVSRRVGCKPRELGRMRVDLELRAVCGLQVVADELVGFDAPPRRAVGDDGRDLLMQGGSPTLRDAGVGLVADERVTETPRLVAEDVGASGSTKSRRASVVSAGRTSTSTSDCTTPVGKVCPYTAAAWATWRSASGSRSSRAESNAWIESGMLVSPFQRRRQQLLEEERVPGSTGENRRTVLVAERSVADEAIEQRASLVRREHVQEDRGRVQPAPGPLGTGVEELRSRQAEQQDRCSGELGNVLHEVEEHRGRPVQVLEHEDERPLPRECLEQPPSGPGRLLDGACRRCFTRRLGDPRRDELAVPLAAEDAGRPGCDAPARKRREGVAERRVGGGLALGGCAADHTGRSARKAVDRLVGETRLAHSGGTEHRDEARSAVAGCAPEGRHDLGELVLASDEWGLETADDGFGVVLHVSHDVLTVPTFAGNCVTNEAPRSLADEDIRLAGGGAQPVGLLERRA